MHKLPLVPVGEASFQLVTSWHYLKTLDKLKTSLILNQAVREVKIKVGKFKQREIK